jgi:hypothetical protein
MFLRGSGLGKVDGIEEEMTERAGMRTVHPHDRAAAVWREFSESASRVQNQREGLGALGRCSPGRDSLEWHCFLIFEGIRRQFANHRALHAARLHSRKRRSI